MQVPPPVTQLSPQPLCLANQLPTDHLPLSSLQHQTFTSSSQPFSIQFTRSFLFLSSPLPKSPCPARLSFDNGRAMAPQRYAAVSLSTHSTLSNSSPSSSPLYPSLSSSLRPSLTALQVNSQDDDDFQSPTSPDSPHHAPYSPPPSFRSRASSPTSRRLLGQDPLENSTDNDLEDAFDDGEASDAENDGDDRQRLMRADPPTSRLSQSLPTPTTSQATVERRVTELPAFRPMPMPSSASRPTDGVFANLSAKPERGEQSEEKPPVRYSPAQHPDRVH